MFWMKNIMDEIRGDLEFASKIIGEWVEARAEREAAWPGVANCFSWVRGTWASLGYSFVFSPQSL